MHIVIIECLHLTHMQFQFHLFALPCIANLSCSKANKVETILHNYTSGRFSTKKSVMTTTPAPALPDLNSAAIVHSSFSGS